MSSALIPETGGGRRERQRGGEEEEEEQPGPRRKSKSVPMLAPNLHPLENVRILVNGEHHRRSVSTMDGTTVEQSVTLLQKDIQARASQPPPPSPGCLGNKANSAVPLLLLVVLVLLAAILILLVHQAIWRADAGNGKPCCSKEEGAEQPHDAV